MAYYSRSALSSLLNSSPLQPRTSIDYLRLRCSSATGSTLVDINDTFGDDIISQLDTDGYEFPTIQVMFLSSARSKGCTTNSLHVKASILEKLSFQLNIPLAFLDAVLKPSIWSKQSGASFRWHNEKGELKSIDGFYHYFNEWDLGPLHVWFSYNAITRLTTYVLVDCSRSAKEMILSNAKETYDCFLLRPLAIDFLIAEQCASWREGFIDNHYKQIFDWHENDGSMDPPLRRIVSTPDGLQSLHQLSRTWNMIYEDLNDFSERLEMLMETAAKLDSEGVKNSQSAIESFKFLHARNQVRRRWVTSFGERTKLVINFIFSIASQKDNQTNLEIANLTSAIAEETRQDNSSMITIATMTMVFLPGTFISAIFSMVFFNYGVDGDGNEFFEVSPKWWLFPTITIPFTLLVILLYQIWRRRREGKTTRRRDVSFVDMGKGNEQLIPLESLNSRAWS